jgi:hypothetical protein
MIRDVELELSRNSLNCMMRSDLAQAEVGENAMNNEEGCRATLGASECFLMEFELLCVDRRICPLQRPHGFHILILVIDNDYFRAKRVLHRLHPMSMNDTGCHFMLCQASIDKTELKHL